MVPTHDLVTGIWWQHVMLVAVFTVVMLAILLWVRGWRDPAKVRRFEIGFGVIGLAISVIVNAWWFVPARFSLEKSLPLQMCDLAALIAPLALLTRVRWLRSLLHFWGFGLCSQWVFTPIASTGMETIEFWMSFMPHASILATAACDVLVGGYRPSWRDWRIGVFGAIAYTLAMVPLDVRLHVNYGFVGNSRPEVATIVDALGPWPLRLVWIVLLAFTLMLLVKLAWYPLGRLRVLALASAAHPVDRLDSVQRASVERVS